MKKSRFKIKSLCGLILSVLATLPQTALADNQINKGGYNSARSELIIDDIVCKGNDTTDCSFITNKYYQQNGDVLDPSEIADAKLRLGTLIQFRDINIHLEKGHKRGHVIVVFDIQEASNIQYEWGATLKYSRVPLNGVCRTNTLPDGSIHNSCSSRKSRSNSAGLNGAITDFNFLGSGKRLSLSFSGGRSSGNSVGTHRFNYSNSAEVEARVSTQFDSHGHTIALDYYDPHLFDSSHYYWRSRISHSKSSTENANYSILLDGSIERDLSPSNVNYTPYNIELGRRFGSHSYISIDTDQVLNSNSISSSGYFGINYGWDSQDDSLFATTGSAFTARFGRSGYNDSVSLSYKSNIPLQHNKVFTWAINSNISQTSFPILNNEGTRRSRESSVSNGLSLRYTSINPIDPSEGVYSGWFTEFNLRHASRSGGGLNAGLAFNAGYIHQSDSMIYRFTLGYQTEERF